MFLLQGRLGIKDCSPGKLAIDLQDVFTFRLSRKVIFQSTKTGSVHLPHLLIESIVLVCCRQRKDCNKTCLLVKTPSILRSESLYFESKVCAVQRPANSAIFSSTCLSHYPFSASHKTAACFCRKKKQAAVCMQDLKRRNETIQHEFICVFYGSRPPLLLRVTLQLPLQKLVKLRRFWLRQMPL